MSDRTARVERQTRETKISVRLDLDGSGKCTCRSGIGFLDHMLEAFARHGFFDLELECAGDLHVDAHHTAEDIGLVLGEAIAEALGDKKGIRRFGDVVLPMDDALTLCAVDLSGRPYLAFDVRFSCARLGTLDCELLREFFLALSNAARMNLHLKQLDGFNNHHVAESCFKALGRALDMATQPDPRVEGVLSTKGSL